MICLISIQGVVKYGRRQGVKLFKRADKKNGFVLLGLMDPDNVDKRSIVPFVKGLEEGGADAILLGGSTGADGEVIAEVAKTIKDSRIKIPLILFPGNAGAITKYADATYFLSIMNTNDAYWAVQYRVLMAPYVKRWNVESISVAYILMEDGETAGWVSCARVIPRRKSYLATLCALAGEYSGSDIILLDSGSNSHMDIPVEAISDIVANVSKPLIYAGGIKSIEQAKKVVESGAAGVQIGSLLEKTENVAAIIAKFRAAMWEGYCQRKNRTFGTELINKEVSELV
ncbi:geranylgeranylglyceryl/heptaprenylglyceryl phosphate synthase [Carboxydocella sp. ULO1]|uniref:geranylgeranylglyceryl/heptaprenylglyceryl phosphate synthase n=1 Tax=Carboxydocella sp. ULO1 TaxID=1926599 RepID=UPI0009ADECBE|nr:geranylgeranylglyceryl/heptaprenylglyceryl phosphate synthase [Carboxydocella sp. ULO1]GAW28622.1 geranylgeranylglyceryl phosphate synthase [Carboxydocella sp. ULO1]